MKLTLAITAPSIFILYNSYFLSHILRNTLHSKCVLLISIESKFRRSVCLMNRLEPDGLTHLNYEIWSNSVNESLKP